MIEKSVDEKNIFKDDLLSIDSFYSRNYLDKTTHYDLFYSRNYWGKTSHYDLLSFDSSNPSLKNERNEKKFLFTVNKRGRKKITKKLMKIIIKNIVMINFFLIIY